MRRMTEFLLALLFVVGLALMIFANPDAIARDWACDTFGACFRSGNASFWNSLMYDIGLAAVASIFFYWLLVKWPENLKRRRLKRLLKESYARFRLEIVYAVLDASRAAGTSTPTYDELVKPEVFKAHFKSPSDRVDGDKWHDVANGLNEHHLRDILASFRILKETIAYILNNIDVADDKAFETLHNMAAVLEYRQDTTLEYEDTKGLIRMLWEIMTGYSLVTGYPKEDPVERIIGRI